MLYAIVQGGMVQDASPEVEVIDLDWMDEGDIPDLEELLRERTVLEQAIREGSLWQGELDAVNESIRAIEEQS